MQKRASRKSKALPIPPKILIFDVDGVLVDVRGTYWKSALETVRYLTGKRVTYAELHKWKSKPGFNDDWSMVSAWVTALGKSVSYEEARYAFEKFYWGTGGTPGNVRNERILVSPRQIEKWAQRFELNLFTGRTRQEFSYSFDRWPATKYFRTIITMDDAPKKPHPDGLQIILGRRGPATALYIGDNIDDALAAREAGVPFLAIIARGEDRYRERAARFRELGALALLPRATELDSLLPNSKGNSPPVAPLLR
ncbi:MAG TPA: HAD-IA family hydrolase [Candidatus Acidoferrum sp.]|nr:HAD-IA family hydrolase [Candidatus Acidoferrum sp.]